MAGLAAADAGARARQRLRRPREWAREDVVKVLCFCHPDDTPEVRAEQEATVKRLWEASRRNRLEFLLEIIPSKVGPSTTRPPRR